MTLLCDKEKCQNIPLYGINFQKNQLFIDYYCKKHMGKIELNYFPLNIIENIPIDYQCQIHKNNYSYYCYDCKKQLCELCIHKEQHYIIEIKKLNKNEQNNLHKKLYEFDQFLNELEFQKNKVIEDLLNFIESIKKSFLNYSNIVSKIKQFISRLLDLYEKKEIKNEINFNLVSNLRQLQFNFKYIEDNNNPIKNSINFVNFCNNIENVPLKQSPLDFELINYQKTKLSPNYNINISKIKKIKTFKYDKCINCLLILKDSRLASASADSYIRIHQLKTFKVILSIKIHQDKVYHLIQLKDERIVSSSRDFTIKIIRLITPTNYILEETLIGHLDFVLKTIELFDDNLVSCSDDKNLIFWKKKNEKFEKSNIFKAHNEGIDCVIELSNNKIASFSKGEEIIKFWDISNYKNPSLYYFLKVKSFGWNNSLFLLDENSLLVSDVSIYIISIKEPIQVISRIEGNNFGSIIKINDKQILIGDIEGFLECYNIKEKSLRYCGKKKITDQNIICMSMMNDGKIIIGEDNLIHVLG